MVYMTKQEWDNKILSQINSDQFYEGEEFAYYKNIYSILKYSVNTLYKGHIYRVKIFISAEILFHKYKICSNNFSFSNISSEELYILMGACLFLGQKISDKLITVYHISGFIKELIDKINPLNNLDKESIKQKIFEKESEILQIISFNCNIDFPINFKNQIKNFVSQLINDDIILKNFMNELGHPIIDSYLLPLALYFIPDVIVISSLKVIKEKCNFDFINLKDLIALSSYKIDEQEIELCFSLIKKIRHQFYKNNETISKEKEDNHTEGKDSNSMTNDASIKSNIFKLG